MGRKVEHGEMPKDPDYVDQRPCRMSTDAPHVEKPAHNLQNYAQQKNGGGRIFQLGKKYPPQKAQELKSQRDGNADANLFAGGRFSALALHDIPNELSSRRDPPCRSIWRPRHCM